MAATKEKPKAAAPPPASASTLMPSGFEVLMQDAHKAAIFAELLLRKYGRSYKGSRAYTVAVSPGDAFVLRAAGFHPDETLEMQREFGRIDNERQFRQQCGTRDELAAVEAEIAAAAAAESEVPELEAQIADLQAKVTRLREAKARPSARLEAMQAARARLREIAPPFIEQEIAWRRRRAVDNPAEQPATDEQVKRILDTFVDAAASAPIDDDAWLQELSF